MTASSCLLPASPRLKRGFPRGVVHIASFLRTHGRAVDVVPLAYVLGERWGCGPARRGADAEDVRRVLAAAVERAGPSVVGIGSALSLDYPDCLEALEIVRAIAPEAVTVIGGPHPTFQDAETVTIAGADGWWLYDDALDPGGSGSTSPATVDAPVAGCYLALFGAPGTVVTVTVP